jgi:protein disulfide-isomerase A6
MFWTKQKNIAKSKLILSILGMFIILATLPSIKTQEANKEEAIFDQVAGIKLKHIDGIAKLLAETDMTFFAYYYKKSSPNSRLGAEFLKPVSQKLAYLANVIMIDCDEIEPKNTPMCEKDPDAPDGFPKMEVYTPPEFKYNPYTKQVNTHTSKMYNSQQVSENMIYNFITQNIPARSVKLNTENFENFANNLEFNKVILFTDKSKTPLLFRGLSNYFYDRLSFGEVDKEQTALLKKFKIARFPTLLVYQTHEDEISLDEPRIEVFSGDIKADHIAAFIGEFALKEKLQDRINRSASDPDSLKYKVAFKNLKKDGLLLYMKKFSQKRFVVYANDKEEVPEDIKKFNMMSNGFFHFININCKSDPDTEAHCRATLKLDEIPSLILYKNLEKDIVKALEKSGNSLPLDFSGIESEMYKEFNGNLKEGNPSTFPALANEAKVNKKVPFIYLHEGEIPLGLHLISSDDRYTKFIDFVVYEHPPKEFLKNLQVNKIPQMIILIQDPEKKDS